MAPIIRAALVQTCNAYKPMPEHVERLSALTDKLDEIRTANLDHHEILIRQAAQAGAQLVGLGELFTAPYFALAEQAFWCGLAEDALHGPTIARLGPLAAELNLVLVAPIYELDTETGNRFNTAVVIDANGTVIGRYRKTHIPCGTNEQARFVETFYYGRSDGGPNGYFPVFDTAVGRLGVAICYDRHFEGVIARLAAAGAQIVLCPAITFGEQSERMWPIESAVDATRHRLFIGASNRHGAEPPWNVHFFGGSYFTGPEGDLPNLSQDERLVIADLPIGQLDAEHSSGWDLARDQRPDIYK
jgi:N-carbamoylputrescine amidase